MLNLLLKYTITNLLVVIVCFFSSALYAENLENVLQTLQRIEKDLNDLQKEVYRNNNGEFSPTPIDDNSFAVLDIRIRDIENQISDLTAYVEDYVFQIEELNDKINDLLLNQSQNILSSESSVDSENLSNDEFIDNENQSLGTISVEGNDQSTINNESLIEDILPNISPEEQYQFAFDLLRSQKLVEAKIALEEFINKNQDHSLAGSANYWIGEIIYLNGNYKEAALTFAEAYQKYPESLKVPDILLRLSKSLSKIDKIDQACITLEELINNYPDSKLLTKAKTESKSLDCQ